MSEADNTSGKSKLEEIKHESVQIEPVSQLRLKRRLIPVHTIERELIGFQTVPIQNVSLHVQKWRSIRALTTYKDALDIGKIVMVKQPTIVWSNDPKADGAVLVNRVKQLFIIGDSEDLIQCAEYVKPDKQCEAMVDKRAGEYCDRHLTRACNMSKNKRMEFASGNSGIEMTWARIRNTKQGIVYETSQPPMRVHKEYTYNIPTKGMISSDGKLRNPTPKTREQLEEKIKQENKSIEKFLAGRRDPGADMLRKLRGLKSEDTGSLGLSRDAMIKMGLNTRKVLIKEEEEAKKRSIEELQRIQKSNSRGEQPKQKKPRYVYL